MSEFIVKYEHDGIAGLSNKITQCREEFETVQKEMNSIVGSLKEAIEGAAEAAYQAGHDKVSGKYTAIITMLNNLTSEMSGATKKMTTADQAAASKVKSGFGKIG